MKRYSNIYPLIYDFENLHNAYLMAAKQREYHADVLRFRERLEENLIDLQNRLIYKSYTPGKYKQFYIHDPKRRLIMAQPFSDRVIQWALYLQLNPLIDKRYIPDSYGCRSGYGPHQAVDKLQQALRMYQADKVKVLKLDIAKFFYRVNHEVLLKEWGKVVKDTDVLWLLDVIINDDVPFGINLDTGEQMTGIGQPIGNLSSQMNANFYMNPLDQYAKHVLKLKHYIRYMDDIVILGTDADELHATWQQIDEFVVHMLHLQLNDKSCIRTALQGVDFCGYRVWPDHIRLRKKSAVRMKRRIKWMIRRYEEGRLSLEKFNDGMMSYLGQLKHCDGYTLKLSILKSIVLKRR